MDLAVFGTQVSFKLEDIHCCIGYALLLTMELVLGVLPYGQLDISQLLLPILPDLRRQ